ncbi:ricin-type beta-trefoil lectin domain protein [Micromonospora sp. WMMD975]|uniref:ricin-type beta-trefoil lectin domain protein n=1 Tax=Micromonospora sp. WMMD975 TaxID=3016087 RepID=UPI00249CB3C4|nr:ricin-type beta-trefoil lectin domain protein [Micromonospora sp. WMMD975]WFE36611.1 ricin-type beta-trefoil lectin domain protein [Micromonospora sp. WMMD975]
MPHARAPRIRGLAARITAGTLAVACSLAVAASPARAADESLTVNFSASLGTPTYRGSGWIYGMTENGQNPPDSYFRDVKFRAMRAGGAQLPGQGWVGGGYDRRWNATVAQARRTAALGGTFVLLDHDLWGADGASISRFPGDNGDWSDYDRFLDRLFSDVRSAGITVQWDIWNEPNISLFWNRPQSQYFELWRRTYQRIRSAFPGMLIVGPSCACVPSTSGWWTQYLDYVKANNVVPDIFSWHSLPGDPVSNVATANQTLDSRGIAHPRPHQINEYGASNEQNPAAGAWYLARLERAGADGLRANWAGGQNLHNDLGNLLTHNSSGQYQPKGEWWAYQFYGSMTGQIASVTPSASYDAFATRDTGSAKILIGGHRTTGNVAVNIQRLDATSGIVVDNQVRVVVQNIPYNNGGAVSGPVTVRDSVVTLSNNGTTVNVSHSAISDTSTVTLLPPGGGGPTNQNVQIVGGQSGRCADVPGATTTNGSQIQLWDCHGNANQRFSYTSGKQLTVYGNKCLDASGQGTANGTPVVIWDCNGQSNQQWNLNADGTITGVQSNLCLDASAFGTTNGTKIQLWQCLNGANQRWTLRP